MRSVKEYRIRNVIATADLRQKVDATLFINYNWGKYDLELYGGRCGYIKDEKIEGRVTIFLSGKMISTGSKSVQGSIFQLEYAMEILIRNGFIEKIKLNPKVQNIVATMDMGARIDLNKVASHIPKTTLESEQFPGAILRIIPGPVCLLFASGKIVIVGLKSEKTLASVASKLHHMLKPFCLD